MVGNAPIYIVHLSTALGLGHVKAAKAEGQPVYAETCPQYLFLNEERYDEPELGGLKYTMSPPLRSKEESDALWEGLKEGHIDVVATDHCPFDFKRNFKWGKPIFPGAQTGYQESS